MKNGNCFDDRRLKICTKLFREQFLRPSFGLVSPELGEVDRKAPRKSRKSPEKSKGENLTPRRSPDPKSGTDAKVGSKNGPQHATRI